MKMVLYKKFLISLLTIFTAISVNASEFSIQKLPNGQTLVIQEVKNNPIEPQTPEEI